MAIRSYISNLFSLENYKSSEHEVIEAITKSVEFKGVNVWVLIFAIFIASIGLNMNSTAVIIGAMLISPLMGPIIGVGLGVGIYDFDLIKKALINLLVMMVISIGSSTIYFLLSPLQEATPELTSRTMPSIWDVLIATFGGFAGITATATKEKGNVIPGVAIATALMPPLCTAGFGIATRNWFFVGGALYLFFINAVFVSMATLLTVRFLRFHKKEFVDAAREKRVKRYIALIVLITGLPSIYIAYNIVRDTVYTRNIELFVENEFDFPNTQVINTKITTDTAGSKVLEVFLIGDRIQQQTIENIDNQRDDYGISDVKLLVKQGIKETENIDVGELRTGILEELYEKNSDALKSKEEKIELLEHELLKYTSSQLPVNEISKEFCTLNKNVEYFTVQPSLLYNNTTQQLDTMVISYVRYKKTPGKSETQQLYDWLKVRTKADSLLVITK
jgi:uncharacterized hydrophobic protein (TIGR00271 family)